MKNSTLVDTHDPNHDYKLYFFVMYSSLCLSLTYNPQYKYYANVLQVTPSPLLCLRCRPTPGELLKPLSSNSQNIPAHDRFSNTLLRSCSAFAFLQLSRFFPLKPKRTPASCWSTPPPLSRSALT